MKKRWVGVALALSAALPAWGAFDLTQAYEAATQSDPTFAAARATRAADSELSVQARAALLPTVALEANRESDRYRQNGVNGRDDSSRYGLVLSQPLFDLASWRANEQGALTLTLAEQQFSEARQDLLLRVAQAYFDVLSAQATLRFAQAQQTAIEEQRSAAQRSFEVGTTTITDRYEAQARFDLSTADLSSAKTDLSLKRSLLANLIGQSVPPELAALPDISNDASLSSPDLKGSSASLDEWLRLADQNNVPLKLAEVRYQIAEREVARNQAGRYPVVALSAGINRSDGNSNLNGLVNDDMPTTVRSLAVNVSLPLYAGGAIDSRIRQSLALRDQAAQNRELARRNAAQAVRTAYLGMVSNGDRVQALKAGQASSLKALEANQVGYEVGVRINIDVLNAQQQLFAVQRDLVRARYEQLLANLRLLAASGDLSVADLSATSALLRATVNTLTP